MKLVELKNENDYSYKENLISLVENAQGPIGQNGNPIGFSPAEIRKSIKILDVLERFKDSEIAEFEDVDYDQLVNILESTRFIRVHRPTIQMIDDVKAASSKT